MLFLPKVTHFLIYREHGNLFIYFTPMLKAYHLTKSPSTLHSGLLLLFREFLVKRTERQHQHNATPQHQVLLDCKQAKRSIRKSSWSDACARRCV